MAGASSYPGALDTDVNMTRVGSSSFIVAADHNNLVDAIEAIEAAVGIVPAGWPPVAGSPADIYSQVKAVGALSGSGDVDTGGSGGSAAGIFPAPVKPGPVAGFTPLNTDAYLTADVAGGVMFGFQQSPSQHMYALMKAPPNTDWQLEVGTIQRWSGGNEGYGALMQDAAGRIGVLMVQVNQVMVYPGTWVSFSQWNQNDNGIHRPGYQVDYFRLTRAGVNLSIEMSSDGEVWEAGLSHNIGDFVGAPVFVGPCIQMADTDKRFTRKMFHWKQNWA